MAEPVYGAFGNILNLDEEGEKAQTYGIYQQRANQISNPNTLQYTYGTSAQPIFEWVRTIQTGERTYDPSNDFDDEALERYRDLFDRGLAPPDALSPDEIMKQVGRDLVGQVGQQAGAQIGGALVDPYYAGLDTTAKIGKGFMNTFSKTPFQVEQSVPSNISDAGLKLLESKDLVVKPGLSSLSAAENVGQGNVDAFEMLNKGGKLTNVGTTRDPLYAMGKDEALNFDSDAIQLSGDRVTQISDDGSLVSAGKDVSADTIAATQGGGFAGYTDSVTESLNWNTDAGAANWSSSAGAAGASFAISLAMGAKPIDAAKQAGGAFVGRALGTALLTPVLGPLAPIVGGTIGSMLGGRVICNELCKQGLIDRKMLVNDYKFTRDYLTPNHVKGYHLWAVWMVKQMRKDRFVSLWQHIVIHRGNEIAYIYGQTDKPDYLGKLYRKVFEPVCWILGSFSKQTDWSILYQKKEI